MGIDARGVRARRTRTVWPHGRPRREAGRNARPAGRDHARRGAEGEQWRRYLVLDVLRTLADRADATSAYEARQLSREILQRLSRHDLTDGQRQFIGSKPVVELAAGCAPGRSSRSTRRGCSSISSASRARTNPATRARGGRLSGDIARGGRRRVGPAAGDELPQRELRFALSEKLLKRLLPGASMTYRSGA